LKQPRDMGVAYNWLKLVDRTKYGASDGILKYKISKSDR